MRRDELLGLLEQGQVDEERLARAVESDVALVLTCLALAQRSSSSPPDGVAGVRAALVLISAPELVDAVSELTVFDCFDSAVSHASRAERFALHARAVQRMAVRLAPEYDAEQLDELASAALLHDIGKLALPGDPAEPGLDSATPQERLRAERLELGVDHAVLGGALLRSWNLPERLAQAVEGHHSEDAEGPAAVVSAADMLIHYQHGDPVDLEALLTVGSRLGLGRAELGSLLWETSEPLAAAPTACPLSGRERQVLRRLARGGTYKQIALDLGISANTVRGHLHRIYAKLGVVDRAQAVLAASRAAWI
jgi:putative nucleotidyltransferase with HDIG domain